MSRVRKAKARLKAATNAALLRRLQTSSAVAQCVRIAVEYGEGEVDIADALSGLLALLEAAAALLDQPEGAP